MPHIQIPREQYRAAYEWWKRLRTGEKHRTVEALTELNQSGLNKNSAKIFFTVLQRMLNGQEYKRAMSVDATDDILGWIRQDFTAAEMHRAVAALELHVEYRLREGRSSKVGLRQILAKYQQVIAAPETSGSALDDLDDLPTGQTAPSRTTRTQAVFRRDAAIRAHALKRAAGRCEHCGHRGFLMATGDFYLEAHHIISLGNEGPDTVHNVIALCAEHHREAHFGARRAELEREFQQKLDQINARRTP